LNEFHPHHFKLSSRPWPNEKFSLFPLYFQIDSCLNSCALYSRCLSAKRQLYSRRISPGMRMSIPLLSLLSPYDRALRPFHTFYSSSFGYVSDSVTVKAFSSLFVSSLLSTPVFTTFREQCVLFIWHVPILSAFGLL